MTLFEKWQAGEGPEPVVVVELPAELSFMPPWRTRRFRCGIWTALDLHEEEAAIEEQGLALRRALVWLPSLTEMAEMAIWAATDKETDEFRQELLTSLPEPAR